MNDLRYDPADPIGDMATRWNDAARYVLDNHGRPVQHAEPDTRDIGAKLEELSDTVGSEQFNLHALLLRVEALERDSKHMAALLHKLLNANEAEGGDL